MARAVARLLVGAALLAVTGLVFAGVVALVAGARFPVVVWLAGGVLLLFAATGSSPSMDRAIGQRARAVVGPLIGRSDETYDGPRASTAAVLVLAALMLFAVGIAIDH